MTPVAVITDPSYRRPHPLGLTSHPEWETIEARHFSMLCGSIAPQPRRTFLERIFDR